MARNHTTTSSFQILNMAPAGVVMMAEAPLTPPRTSSRGWNLRKKDPEVSNKLRRRRARQSLSLYDNDANGDGMRETLLEYMSSRPSKWAEHKGETEEGFENDPIASP